MSFRHLFTLLISNAVLVHIIYSKEILWSDDAEAQLLQAMFLQAHKGKWFPMVNKSPPYDDFILKGGCLFKEGEDIPFTGWYAQFDEFDEPRMLCSFVDGKKNGFSYLWDENGTRRFQGEYLNNAKNGKFFEWNSDGIQTSEKNYHGNRLSGYYQLWYDSGKIKMDAVFQNGKLIKAQGWYPDGRPCPYSKVANGRGIMLRYEGKFNSKISESLKTEKLINKLNPLPDLNFTRTEKNDNSTKFFYESDQFHPDQPKTD